MLRIAVVGASGRMGRSLIKATHLSRSTQLTVAISRLQTAVIGRDAGELAGIGSLGVRVSDDLAAVVDQFDVLIDFTRPNSSMEFIEICRRSGKKLVIGTTGYTEEQKALIHVAAEEVAMVWAPNMSVGVNLSLKLLEMTTQVMGQDCDIEIIEAHHRHKIDAPSGTALRMGEVIAGSLGKNLKECAVYAREGNIGTRDQTSIGFSTIRAGDIVGEHTVMFANEGERLEITHRASSRMTFANGAIRAALWLKDKTYGIFDMRDVLGLD